MNKIACILIASTLLLSSCASNLNSKYQKVTILTDSEATLLVEGRKPKKKDGKYLIKRISNPTEITIQKEGFKDSHHTIVQHKRSPWYILSWIPFAVTYSPFFDNGSKACNFEKEYDFRSTSIKLPTKNELVKDIKLNNISADIDSTNLSYRLFNRYKVYLKKKNTKKVNSTWNNDVKIENTVFTDQLNEILANQGYIDTTNKVLTKSYTNNLYLNATIKGITMNEVNNWKQFGFMGGSFGYVDLEINWELLNFYKEEIFQFSTTTQSGQFEGDFFEEAISDAMETGLIEFFNNETVQKELLKSDEDSQEEKLEELTIVKPDHFVEHVSDVIESSVTIKNKLGHGSGFVISPDGYIVTNYHVISEKEDLKVVMNNQEEFNVEIVRVNKIYDLALLKIDTTNLKPLKISADRDIEIASTVYAVGTPNAVDLGQTISKGIISGIRDTNFKSKLIQTDSSINGGNSGGAIINKNGLVLGVVSSKLKGFGIEGVAFGIPSYEIFDQLKIKFE